MSDSDDTRFEAAPETAALYQWALLFNESGDVLLLQPEGEEAWTLPGGPLSGDERQSEHLVDQVDAATGLAVRTVTPVAASRFDRGGEPEQGFGVAYLCEILGDRTTELGARYDNVGWLPAEAVDEATLPRANQHRVLQAAIGWREWLAEE
jgi:ADP-ribose pyrophosphatase YjhB (NUDIX family)